MGIIHAGGMGWMQLHEKGRDVVIILERYNIRSIALSGCYGILLQCRVRQIGMHRVC